MLTEWELWAVASKVLERHGDRVGTFLQQRIAELDERNDVDGITMWLGVSQRILALRGLIEGETVQ